MNRAEKAALQLQAVAVLRTLKETRTYEELSTLTELPAGDLNRYVNGHVLPGTARAQAVVADIGREALADELLARITRQRLASGIELTYYLPARAIESGDVVLVVDDLIRSGETQELLLDIALQADADVAGVFTLIAVGDEGMQRARDLTDAPVGALATFE